MNKQPGARLTTLVLLLIAMLVTGCKGDLNDIVTQFNTRATQVAGGELPTSDPDITPTPGGEATPVAGPSATPTQSGMTTYDLTTNPNAELVQAWGRVYGLGSGAEFTIKADQFQVGEYIIQLLRTSGWESTVRGGSVTLAVGQVRLDVAIVDQDENFGSGTVTFQPTLTESGLVRLNPQGANFSGLAVPDNFTQALGDVTRAALTGAQRDDLSRVNLNQLSLDSGILTVVGTHR